MCKKQQNPTIKNKPKNDYLTVKNYEQKKTFVSIYFNFLNHLVRLYCVWDMYVYIVQGSK